MKTLKSTLLALMVVSVFSCSKDDDSPNPGNQAPESFNLITVADGSSNVDLKPTFSWEPAIDPDGDAVSYDVYLDTENPPTTAVASGLGDITYTPQDNLNPDETYYWAVVAKDGNQGETLSNVASFTTEEQTVGIVVIDYNIDSETVLKNNRAGIDYEICEDIAVKADLIIEPGVEIVMCAGASVVVENTGSLNAVGIEDSPIIIRGKTASPGFWEVLHFDSNNPSNELNHVSIADGGGSSSFDNASIWVNDNNEGQLTFKNSTIKDSKGYGLLVEGDASIPNFNNNKFSNNGDAPVYISMLNIGSLDESSDYGDGNTNNYIEVQESSVNSPQVAKNINVPYLIKGDSNIGNDLKLDPGVRFLMDPGASIYISSSGSMNAIGTNSKPITIKGKVDAVGSWNVIHIDSNNPLNEFAFVDIKNGGSSGSFDYASIWVNNNNNGTFIMNDCSISDSYSWGLFIENGANMTPSTKAGVESVNTFNNNGTGTNANCTDGCTVLFE